MCVCKESVFQTSPGSRRDSMPLVDKMKVDVSLLAKAKLVLAAEKEQERKKKETKPKEELPMIKYLETQATDCFQLFRVVLL